MSSFRVFFTSLYFETGTVVVLETLFFKSHLPVTVLAPSLPFIWNTAAPAPLRVRHGRETDTLPLVNI